MERKIDVIDDLDGNKIVVIHDVIFKGKRSMDWADVEEYLKQFIGECYFVENTKDMIYIKDAKYGWYSYVSRFAMPVYDENEEIERYNVFRAIMLVRHAEDNKLYLYDIIKIKKETSTLFQSRDLTQ